MISSIGSSADCRVIISYEAEAEQKQALRELEKEKKALGGVEKLYADVSKDWKKQENRILGHVVLSPPIVLGVGGGEGFTEDWAVIEVFGEPHRHYQARHKLLARL